MQDYLNWLELSRGALLHNLAAARALAGTARIIAVVKANAYGAGAVGVVRVLEQAGVDAFAVATVAEGVELRQAGIGGLVLCLTYFTSDEVDAIMAHDLTPAVFTSDAAQMVADAVRRNGRRQSVWVKVDTGLNRLGVPHADAPAFLRAILAEPNLQLTGVFSTIAETPERDARQLERMRALRTLPELAGVPFSLASSHALMAMPEAALDAVRPGIMLLGFEPSERERLDMRLVEQASLRSIATWKARVGYVKPVVRGDQVGYGERTPLKADSTIATLTVGWADGYPARMSEGGCVLVRGQRCAVLAVSANSTLVDASIPGAALGEEVVLMGTQGDAQVTPYELANATGSVYRLLWPIPRETPRVWVT
ncbi:MAG: alanine racemase [Chloroflexi bacterium]|nr:alanine racemase [Chloroflexota bacterium]